MEVAVVDYEAPDAPAVFTESVRETGFAVLINHPLPFELVSEIYQEWAEFFTSAAVDDYVFDHEGQVGFFPADRSETAKGNDVADLKEFFHVYDWSVYPSEVSDAALRYRDMAIELTATLLGWIAANTPTEVAGRFSVPLEEMLDGSKRSLLRVLRYPPLDGTEHSRAVRAAAHEDINLLTVLPAATEPGLELLGAAGEWFPVPCDAGSLAVNGGEMLDLASGGYYPATTHRVVNPSGTDAGLARMALPLFLSPADDVVLADGRTASSFRDERIAELRGSSD